ncbi:MAG: hypothetical protein KDB03_09565 [Planctomycetales bacterium]|nr:hypothetical protein [Planctomycetales bacterium]
MSELLLYYQRPEPATWVFLSSFLLIGIFFVFHRFFCIRNLDILLLILLAPGLMMVYEGRKMRLSEQSSVATSDSLAVGGHPVGHRWPPQTTHYVSLNLQSNSLPSSPPSSYATDSNEWQASTVQFYGFLSLLIACGLLMIRMLVDQALVRRPLLEPNLNIGGLSFIGISLFLFLMANIVTSSPREQQESSPRLGPGYALLNMLPSLPTIPDHASSAEWPGRPTNGAQWLPNVARILAIVSNLAIVIGIIGVGYWHFDNIKTGIGCATMYLMLPYTAQMNGNLEHTTPAALLTLALMTYRQPMFSGLFLGAAAGLVYYPLFLLPLWFSFYWHKGIRPFLMGVSISLLVLVCLLLIHGMSAFTDHLRWMFGLWLPMMEGLSGIWGEDGLQAVFRLPVLVGFILLSLSFCFWPIRKNLGTLMCGTAAIMLAAQFWHGYGGGLFMAWFLPFVLLTIFRPNVDDRVANKVVGAKWFSRHVSSPV